MRREKGSVIIEFLFVVPILFVLLAAVYQVGKLVYTHQRLVIASRLAAERATMPSRMNGGNINATEAMFFPYDYRGRAFELPFKLAEGRILRNTPILGQMMDVLNMLRGIDPYSQWPLFPAIPKAQRQVKQYLAFSGFDTSLVTVEYRVFPYIKYLKKNRNGRDSIPVRPNNSFARSVGYLQPGEVRNLDQINQPWWREDAQREQRDRTRRITRYELPYGVWLVAAKVTYKYPTPRPVQALLAAASVILGTGRTQDTLVLSRTTVFPAPLSMLDQIDMTQSLRMAQFDRSRGRRPNIFPNFRNTPWR